MNKKHQRRPEEFRRMALRQLGISDESTFELYQKLGLYEKTLKQIKQAAESGACKLKLSAGMGLLPPEIGQLKHLQMLVFENTEMVTLPPEISQLKHLQVLEFKNTGLTTLPPEIGQLSNLQCLRIIKCPLLATLPPEIGQLSNLQYLELVFNGLAMLPPEIGQLSNLHKLCLRETQLEELSPEIGQLVNLQHLELSNNRLIALPAEIGQLPNLQHLDLCDNRLTVLPSEIGQLTNLQTLYVNDNRLDILPAEIGQLTNLEFLNLSNNCLTTLPIEIGQLTNLRDFGLRGDDLKILPSEIGQMTNLHGLDLRDNRLETLPAEISQLSNLQLLYLDENPLCSWPEQGPAELYCLGVGNCRQLTSLPHWLKRVNSLYINGCERLNRLPDHLQIVEQIELGDSGLTSLPAATAPDVKIRWREMQIDQRIAFAPGTITIQEVFDEENMEKRRLILERMGYARFIREANPEELDQDVDAGGIRRLLQVDLPRGRDVRGRERRDEPFVGLEVIDPSTGRQYILRVPPNMRTCNQAAAWIAGFDNPDDYYPVQET